MSSGIQRQSVGETDRQYLERAFAYCRKEYKRSRQTEHCHESHTADDVMRECERLFPDLGTCGTEGFCSDDGAHGISYLNTGDTYALTIIFQTFPRSVRWLLGDWGTIVENSPKGRFQ